MSPIHIINVQSETDKSVRKRTSEENVFFLALNAVLTLEIAFVFLKLEGAFESVELEDILQI